MRSRRARFREMDTDKAGQDIARERDSGSERGGGRIGRGRRQTETDRRGRERERER